MTITVAYWAIPLLLTAAIQIAAVFWPARSNGVGLAVEGLVHFGLATIATLLVWLVYFMVT
jgi:hypothetical protein